MSCDFFNFGHIIEKEGPTSADPVELPIVPHLQIHVAQCSLFLDGLVQDAFSEVYPGGTKDITLVSGLGSTTF